MSAPAATLVAEVPVEGGAVPVHVHAPEDPSGFPALVVVPSIFGPAPDLLEQMATLADVALTVVADPFWRVGGGFVPYTDRAAAFARLKDFDPAVCLSDMRAVIEWARVRSNGHVVGLGICFGGPAVLAFAAEGLLDGLVAWHGSRMDRHLDGASAIRCPVRFHFGSEDPITPPEAIEKIEAAFAGHDDAIFVVHEGLEHGFSHVGRAYDADAARAGLGDTRDLLTLL